MHVRTRTATALLVLCSCFSFSTLASAGRYDADEAPYPLVGQNRTVPHRIAEPRYMRRTERRVSRRQVSQRMQAQQSAGFGQPPYPPQYMPMASADPNAGRTRAAARSSVAAAPAVWSGGSNSSLVAEARRWIGTNPTGRSSLWCARFMNFVLQRTGHGGTSSDMARSFASYGHRLPGPQVGAIAVMGRGGRGGHVGVVSGIDEHGNPIIISGNHGRRVGEGVYSRSRVYAYVAP